MEVGRYTSGLLPGITEGLQLLGNWDHFGIQLLNGEGAFADYLVKHEKLPPNYGVPRDGGGKRCPRGNNRTGRAVEALEYENHPEDSCVF